MTFTSIEDPGSSEPDIVIGDREQLFHLLAEASEIEHTLMCSYLFAAFSLRPDTFPDFSDKEAQLVKQWRAAIMGVAIEEMGHLLIVSNLIAAIGGRPHFTRPNFPVTAGYFPSGVSLALAPFSGETLDHFIFLERPTGVEGQDAPGFVTEECAREQPHLGLMPNVQDYATVSHLYEAIRTNLRTLSREKSDTELFIGNERGQLGSDRIRMEGIDYIGSLAAAELALDLIVEQGEGGGGGAELCHYAVFSRIRAELAEAQNSNPDFRPAYPVVESPVMRRHADMDGKVLITGTPAAQLLDFCNATYGVLLRLLVQTYVNADDHNALVDGLISDAFELMHVVGVAASVLASLPATEDRNGGTAGMTFTMLRGVEPFLTGRPEHRIINERLHQLAQGARDLATVLPVLQPVHERLQEIVKRRAEG